MRANKKYLLAAFVSMAVTGAAFVLMGGKAQAASLTIDNGCTLAEAIEAINNADNGNGCTATGEYGTDDTITLPAGTYTTTDDLPGIEKSLHITGAGVGSTIVNFDGHTGFRTAYNSDHNTKEITIEGMSLIGASPMAINIEAALRVTLNRLDISNSEQAISIRHTEHVVFLNSLVHNNTDDSIDENKIVGAYIGLGSYHEGRTTDLVVDKVKIMNNSGDSVGLYIVPRPTVVGNESSLLGDATIAVGSTTIMNNQARLHAGLLVISEGGPMSPTKIHLGVSATTIANNTVTVVSPQQVVGPSSTPIVAGFMIAGVLTDSQHFTNVTVAYNTVTNPAPDDRITAAGFLGSLGISGSNLHILNTTVVGNKATQPSSKMALPAFFATKIGLNESYQPSSVQTGSTATNVLVAQNSFNNSYANCSNNFNTVDFLGIDLGVIDLTPQHLGHNMSDDQSCTGYKYVANLYDTIEHNVSDNGGPVPTIKLLPGSPAINGGGQVQGIATDARGVTRQGYYSVGAYQGELLAATTTAAGGGTLAETGVVTVSAMVVSTILAIVLLYTYIDYRRHRKPLIEADPFARQTYTYRHHIGSVTVPLLRYRMHVSVTRKPDPSGVTKF